MLGDYGAPRKKRRAGLIHFVGLSVLAHVLLLVYVNKLQPSGQQAANSALNPQLDVNNVSYVPAAELKEQLKRQDKADLDEERDKTGQVVALPRPAEEKQPTKSRFLSEYDTSVARETQSKRTGDGTSKPKPLPPAGEGKAADGKEAANDDQPRGQTKLAMRAPTPPSTPEQPPRLEGEGGAAPVEPPPQPQPPASEEAQGAPGEGRGARQGLPGMKDLRLTAEDFEHIFGPRVRDAITDVDEGDETALNSRRWRFASFFNRVKEQVAQNWHPDREYRRRDPSGNVYGFRDRLTVLRVTLSNVGGLTDVEVEQHSGLAFLDDEAVNAFRLAQPFPNPPKALIDEGQGKISFRFGFLFELSHRPNLHIFRYND